MSKTNIEYADEVSNPLYAKDVLTGKAGTHCEKPDPEGTCRNCWAEMLNTRGKPDNKRFGTGLAYDKSNRNRIEWHPHEREMARLERLNKRKPVSEKFPGMPLVVFTNDTYDLFQPSITNELRDWVFDNYDKFKNLTLLVQTTYVSRMAKYLTVRYPNGMPHQYMIGMSAGTQKFFADNIEYLVSVAASRRYVIFEPLLEEIGLIRDPGSGHKYCWAETLTKYLNLVIIGGESGATARPCDVRWIRRLVKVGTSAGVAVLVKQMGSHCRDAHDVEFEGETPAAWPPGTRFIPCPEWMIRTKPEASMRILLRDRKGGKPVEWPDDLRIRAFPKLAEGSFQ